MPNSSRSGGGSRSGKHRSSNTNSSSTNASHIDKNLKTSSDNIKNTEAIGASRGATNTTNSVKPTESGKMESTGSSTNPMLYGMFGWILGSHIGRGATNETRDETYKKEDCGTIGAALYKCQMGKGECKNLMEMYEKCKNAN